MTENKVKAKRKPRATAKPKKQSGPQPKKGPMPPPRSWRVALLLSLFLGMFGADRFYIGRTRSGIVKLITLGFLGIWWLSDVILIAGEWRLDAWRRPLKH